MSSILLSSTGTAILAGGGKVSLGVSGADLTINAAYTETASGTGDGAIDGKVVSPGAIWLEVTGWTGWDSATENVNGYNQSLHRIEYFWTITGPGDFSDRSDTNLPSDPAVFRDLSKQKGPRVVFPLSAAGTYNWTCFAVEIGSGKAVTKTGSVTTVSEDQAFPGTRTICYSPLNNFTDAPPGSDNETTLAGLNAAIDAFDGGSTFRVLFRRGETYNGLDVDLNAADSTNFPNRRFNVYGSGADPIIERPFGETMFITAAQTPLNRHVFFGPIHWKGGWDAANERGHVDTTPLAFPANLRGTFTYFGSTITGIQNPYGALQEDNIRFAAIKVKATDFFGFGLSMNAFPSHTDRHMAWIGGFTGWPSGATDGQVGRLNADLDGQYVGGICNGALGAGWVFRFSTEPYVIFQHHEIHAAVGYTGGKLAGDPAVPGVSEHQPGLRINWGDRQGVIYNIAYCLMEGGNNFMGHPTGAVEAFNTIVDSSVFIATGNNYGAIQCWTTGKTIRNNHFHIGFLHRVDFASKGTSFGVTPMFFNGNNGGITGNDEPVEIYNNSYIDRKSGRFYAETSGFASLSQDIVENNIKLNAGDTANLTTTRVIAGYTPRYVGYKPGFPIIPHTLGATWSNGGTFTISYPDSGTYYTGEGTGGQTDQSYWTGLPGTDSKHAIKLADGSYLYAEDGDFSVSFDASVITFTNNTGAGISAQAISIKLDRASRAAANVDTEQAPDYYGAPVWVDINATSPATYVIASGLKSHRDIENSDRGGTAYQGAVEYA